MTAQCLRRCTAVLIAFGVVMPACGSSSPSSCPSTQAERMYGCGPATDGSVTYQPDVVILSGGADAVRSWSPDGLTWIIKGDAGGVDQLQRGKIMFVTGLAVGRVLAVKAAGGDRVITLGPATMTDVIRDGTFSSSQPISLASPLVYTAPSLPGTSNDVMAASAPSNTASGASATPNDIVLPPVELTASSTAPTLPPAQAEPDVQVGPGDYFHVLCCKSKLGASFRYNDGGLRIVGSMYYTVSSLSASYSLEFHNGTLVNGSFQISGIHGLHIDVDAATLSGATGNINKTIYIPVDFKVPLGASAAVASGASLPDLSLGVMQFWDLRTRFSSKKSVLLYSGDYSFSAGIGSQLGVSYTGGAFSFGAPTTFTTKKSLLKSLTGAAVGVAGVDIFLQARLCVCFGAYVYSDGLFYGLGSGFTVTNDSSAVAVLGGRCKGAEYSLQVRYGEGHHLAPEIAGAINARLAAQGAAQFTAEGGLTPPTFTQWDKVENDPSTLDRCQ